MKIKIFLSGIIIALIFSISGCGDSDKELKKNAKDFADKVCRNIEIIQKLRATNPADSLSIQKLQEERQRVDSEMMVLSNEFKKKYGDKVKNPEFIKEYRKFLNESMLDCKFLSKEDRANFERELKKVDSAK